LQAKREKVRQKELRIAQQEARENDDPSTLRGSHDHDEDDGAPSSLSSSAILDKSTIPDIDSATGDVGFSGDLRTIFAKEPQSVIDARKRDATRELVMAVDRGNSQSIYIHYGITDIANQLSIPVCWRIIL
jgi:hypothetical protein